MKMSQKSADQTTAFYAQVRSQLEGSDGITFSSENILTWQVPIKEKQFLNVTLSLSLEPLSNGNHYQIIAWNTSNNYEWGEDQTIPLPQKERFPDISMEE